MRIVSFLGRRLTWAGALAAGLGLAWAAEQSPAPVSPAVPPRYEFREPHDPDGIGTFYMGREIAQVMGHQGADWLERPERETEEHPADAIDALRLRPGDVVADIGCGTGYFSWRLAQKVGERGVVYGVDIQPEMLDNLAKNMAERGVKNVRGVLGTSTDPKLPAGALDLVILVDVYHEFERPFEMMTNICRAVKPGGRVVLVEYRAEDPKVPIKPLHKMTEAQVLKEMSVQPLDWVETIARLPRQHILVFRRR